MDVDDIVMCSSHTNKHVANMWDKIEIAYSYKRQMVVAKLFGSHYHVEQSRDEVIVIQ